MKSWRLTPLAKDSLVDIALWTITTFGESQAGMYEDDLIERCDAIASGRAGLRDCSILSGTDDSVGLCYARAGEHFVIVLDDPDEVIIVDFLHSHSDLPRHIAALKATMGS